MERLQPNLNSPRINRNSNNSVSMLQKLLMVRQHLIKYKLLQIEAATVFQEPVFHCKAFFNTKHIPKHIQGICVAFLNTDFVATGIGCGRSKKKAKEAAAKNLLHLLEGKVTPEQVHQANGTLGVTDITAQVVSPFSDKVMANPIGRLQEMCRSRGWNKPLYETENIDGLSHRRQYTITCEVLKDNGISIKEIGTGKTMKLAKRMAALKMWQTLKLHDLPMEGNNLPQSASGEDDKLKNYSKESVALKVPEESSNILKRIDSVSTSVLATKRPKFSQNTEDTKAPSQHQIIDNKDSLELGPESPKQVFGRHSCDNAETSTTSSSNESHHGFILSQNLNKELKVFNNPYASEIRNSSCQGKTSTLQNKLLTFSNTKDSNHNADKVLLKKQPSQEPMNVDNEFKQASEISGLEFPSTSTSKWMATVNPPAGVSDVCQNDSLLVNVDDTLLNKSKLMTELQEDASAEWAAISESVQIISSRTEQISTVTKEPFICIVTDTNVFLHDLFKISELLALSTSGKHKLKIFIPWMVQQEIDSFKDSFSLNLKPLALAAQKLINSQLMQPDAKVIGQSITDVCDQIDLGKAPDDKILACLLQTGKKYDSVILLSNDIGLRNKAISNNFKAYAPKEVLAMIINTKYLRIKIRLQNFLSKVIFYCFEKAFSDLCTKMEVLQGFPWTFEECLYRFKRHWSSAFQQLLLKHCYKCIDELLSICSQGDILDSDQIKLTKFKDKVKEFLFYIQDVQHFNSTAKKMRAEVDIIFSSSSTI